MEMVRRAAAERVSCPSLHGRLAALWSGGEGAAWRAVPGRCLSMPLPNTVDRFLLQGGTA